MPSGNEHASSSFGISKDSTAATASAAFMNHDQMNDTMSDDNSQANRNIPLATRPRASLETKPIEHATSPAMPYSMVTTRQPPTSMEGVSCSEQEEMDTPDGDKKPAAKPTITSRTGTSFGQVVHSENPSMEVTKKRRLSPSPPPDDDDDDDNDDDGELVEEDPLPLHLRPAGVFEWQLHEKRKRELAALSIVPYPPRTIGTFRDQNDMDLNEGSICSCREGRCLMLYCACFSKGEYCTSQCWCCKKTAETSKSLPCANRKGKEFADHRRDAIRMSRLVPNDNNSGQTQISPRCGKANCPCFLAGPLCGKVPVECPCRLCHAISPEQKENARKFSSKSVNPVRIDGKTVIEGLCTTSAAGYTPTSSSGKDASQSAKPVSGILYHELMLAPSKITPQKKSAKVIRPTELEQKWNAEGKDLDKFFALIGEKFRRRNEDDAEDEGPNERIQAYAASVLDEVEDDLRQIKTVVDAAGVDIKTRLFEEKSKRRSFAGGVADSASDASSHSGNNDEGTLFCNENLPDVPEERTVLPDPEKLKEFLVVAAQDTALLRETAKIIRRKAREMCARRTQASQEKPKE